MLKITNIETFYGNIQALFGVSLHCKEGELTTLIGRNGMGKTTTIHSILGITPVNKGAIRFQGQHIENKTIHSIARHGIGFVPEGRQIFPNLTVRENLIATAANYSNNKSPWTLKRVLTFFPNLAERLNHMGNQLSGGEQQMLAIGRALMLNPKLLILDEATEGLAPLVRQEIWQKLETLKKTGMTILLVDKNLQELAPIADKHYIIEKGKIVWNGSSNNLITDEKLKQRYLGV